MSKMLCPFCTLPNLGADPNGSPCWLLRVIGRLLRLVLRRQPRQTVVDAVSGCCDTWLHVPIAVVNFVEFQPVRDLLGREGAFQVLLVGKHKDDGILHLAVCDDSVEL